MKLTAIKAAVAICMLVPVMAMAKETKPVATTFSYTFSDVADTNVKIGKNNAQGFLLVQASWTDLLSGFKSMVQSQASSLTWSLTSSNGKQTFQQGVLADVAGDLNKGVIVLNESSLSKGEYKLTLSGIWSGSATGIKDNWEHQDVKVNLGAKTFSAVSPVPEPESYAMLLAGLGLMGTIALRRKKSDAS